MQIFKTYTFRLYPNKETIIKLNKFLGSSRFIYNYYLKQKENNYKKGITYNYKEMAKDLIPLKNNNLWLKEIDSCILQNTLKDLDTAYNRYFNKMASHPKYKSKNSKNTYRTTCIKSSYKNNNYSNIKVDLENKTIKLPKLGIIKIKGYRKLTSFKDKDIKHVTIKKEAGKYYAEVCVCENIIQNIFIPNYIIGLDLGVKDLVITSLGEKYKNELKEKMLRIEKKIKGLNKWLSRCQKGSNNRQKVIKKIARANQKLKNTRKYYTHYITNEIVKNNDIIALETLDIQKMIEQGKKQYSKYIISSCLSEIIRQIKYKAKWLNKKVYEIDKYYASSQICSRCGNKDKQLKDLNIRKYRCQKCRLEIDRDINASINIMFEGLKKYMKEQYA